MKVKGRKSDLQARLRHIIRTSDVGATAVRHRRRPTRDNSLTIHVNNTSRSKVVITIEPEVEE